MTLNEFNNDENNDYSWLFNLNIRIRKKKEAPRVQTFFMISFEKWLPGFQRVPGSKKAQHLILPNLIC